MTGMDKAGIPGALAPDNQPPARPAGNLVTQDVGLCASLGASAGGLVQLGAWLDSPEAREMAWEANRFPPELHLFDRGGRRLDEVRFHPSYHGLLGNGLEAGYAACAWEGAGDGHQTHAAMVYLFSQVEPGVCCPMTMTYAAFPALEGSSAAALWQPRLEARAYEAELKPIAAKGAATLGMAMTEKQGGSDVRANVTRAERDGEGYRLYGHKWFCSAPMSDGFLTLAQAAGGLTCFLVPRVLPDGSRNRIHLMRLKEKLGNRANASAEIEYHGAYAERIGEEGEGVRAIIRMVHHTRLDTALAPAGLMRAALTEAHWWCAHRSAFQKLLIDAPLMRRVLADLSLDQEAALALGMRVARAFDGKSSEEAAFARIAVAVAKFLNNKRCVNVIYEAMECLGGMGYTDDTPLPMLYREAPLNSIWEGSGNVICLDILRTLSRDRLAGEVLLAELEAARGRFAAYDAALDGVVSELKAGVPEAEARRFSERLGDLLAACALMVSGPEALAESYVKRRLSGAGQVAGSVAGLAEEEILARWV
ncbi:acyl-CoA dehydrogenase family protein [Pseudoruegeria sp. SHC-113]|uniref:acyl-CoA dehydrogenase family protein n=1 Tax=Pseudoruegeria sp. SHC-113 TaxID=2855439 RepID=UPI0021BAEBF2|nr:acyl-CoA dehydrogenase family protein [Pseudoruegeria sp. SHC-113]MCT8160139.1 acyl-CoA dehydrogenase family protein [Pseudoruegeria sp. SHC-113]